MVVLGAAITFTSTVSAFLDQSLKRAQEGKDPITGVSMPPFAPPVNPQAQVDAGLSAKTLVSPAK